MAYTGLNIEEGEYFRAARFIQLLSIAESVRALQNEPLIPLHVVEQGALDPEQARAIVSEVEQGIEHLVTAVRLMGHKPLELPGLNIGRVNEQLEKLGAPPLP